LTRLLSSPTTMIWRVIDTFRGFLNVSLFSWVIPFYQNFYANRLKDIVVGLVFATFIIGLVYFAHAYLKNDLEADEHQDNPFAMELLWVGLLGTFGGILPIVLANRVVTFERISQYTLPASLTGVIFLGGLVYSVVPKSLRVVLLSGLIALAVLSHHGLAAQAANEEKTITNFWWQVSWRAPDIRSGTTLVATYPGINYAEGNDVVWGPANFIYSARKQGQTPVFVPISASRLEPDSVLEIISANKAFEQTDYVIKDISTVIDHKNQLILSQASEAACVHALDPRWPDISIHDQPFIHASAQNSHVENIILDAKHATPPAYAFGLEPSHDWCYYYEKADLARQSANWIEVARIGDEAQRLGLHPNDQIEWMPFLQAYAILGDSKAVKGISTRINTERFYRQQACAHLNRMPELGFPLPFDMSDYVNELFCQ